jgi:hypothetical protein
MKIEEFTEDKLKITETVGVVKTGIAKSIEAFHT